MTHGILQFCRLSWWRGRFTQRGHLIRNQRDAILALSVITIGQGDVIVTLPSQFEHLIRALTSYSRIHRVSERRKISGWWWSGGFGTVLNNC